MNTKILIYDTDSVHSEFIKIYLSDRGFEVITTDEESKTWEILNEQEISLIIIDVDLEQQCEEMVVKIRQHPEWANLHIILTTSVSPEASREFTIKGCYDDLIFKQEGVDYLEERIRRLLFILPNLEESFLNDFVGKWNIVGTKKNNRILIIDDEEDLRDTINRALKKDDYEVHFAINGEEGIRKISEIQPNVVLMDLKMPVMGGLDVLKILDMKEDSPFSVIIITGHGGQGELKACYKLGAKSFLRKPFDPIELRALVKQNVELNSFKNSLITKNHFLDQKLLEHAEELKMLNRTFRLFVPEQFLELIENSSHNSLSAGVSFNKNLTILFSDIRSFTRMSEKMTSQDNFNFLNKYFGKMEPHISEHDGIIDKYIGDGIMALFDKAGSEENAVDAAIGMQKSILDYNVNRLRKGRTLIRIGIGIHTGEVMVGTIGSPKRLDSTAVGDTVNTTSRLEQWTKRYNSKILISEEVLNKLPKDKFLIRQVDILKFTGKNKPLKVFEVYNADEPEIQELKSKTLPQLQAGIAFYRQGKFDEALSCFSRIVMEFPEDSVVLEYSKRCQYYMKNKPDEGWDGITNGSEDIQIMHRRRSSPRINYSAQMKVEPKKSRTSYVAETIDISRNGLQIALNRNLKIGDLVMLEFNQETSLLNAIAFPHMRLLSQVVWVTTPDEGVKYSNYIGVEFVTLSMEQEKIIHELIMELAERESQIPKVSDFLLK